MLLSAILLIAAFATVDAGPAVALGAQCSGSGAQGKGAFLQRRAQIRWSSGNELGFNGSPSALACSGSQGSGGNPEVSYAPFSEAKVSLEEGPFDASKFAFLGALSPQGAFGVDRRSGGEPRLAIYSSEGTCFYRSANLGGQVVNGGSFSPVYPYGPEEESRLILQGLWLLLGGSEGSCPEALQQSSSLRFNAGEGGGLPLYIAGE